MTTSKSKAKGSRGEREVMGLWHEAGWQLAERQPGSGAWDPRGYPADIGAVPPFVVEVKMDRKLRAREVGTRLAGGAFLRRELPAFLERVGRLPDPPPPAEKWIPVLFGRPGAGEGPGGWLAWIPGYLFHGRLGTEPNERLDDMVGVPAATFFELIGGPEDWH